MPALEIHVAMARLGRSGRCDRKRRMFLFQLALQACQKLCVPSVCCLDLLCRERNEAVPGYFFTEFMVKLTAAA